MQSCLRQALLVGSEDVSCFLRGEGKGKVTFLPVERAGKHVRREQKLLCRVCRLEITDESQALEVNNMHCHTFFNPAGMVFEVSCFADAAGCRQEGVPSTHFSWFADTSWQVAVCRSCATHLGWFFQGPSTRFYGLIRNRLISE